jgi:RNA polymerase sigma-70 factor (ECF subfamily)
MQNYDERIQIRWPVLLSCLDPVGLQGASRDPEVVRFSTMSNTESDRALLDSIRRDDPGAFEEFVRCYGGQIYAFGVRVCGQSEDARDVAQETLMQAFLSLKDVKEPGALRSWLYRVVSNACLMRRRKGKYEPRQELTLEELMPRGREDAEIQIPDAADLPDDQVARGEIHAAVHEGIEQLAPEYRMVLLLRDIEQLSTREVAVALNLNTSTVKMRLHRARLQLRQVLAERLGKAPRGKGNGE